MRRIRNRPEQKSERSFQMQLVKDLRAILAPSVFMTAFPAGVSLGRGRSRIIRGKQLKDMGLVAGVPDLLFIYLGRAFLMELKTEDGTISDVQLDCQCELVEAGAEVASNISTLKAAIDTLQDWGIPLRASLSKTQERKAA